ncbi:MAG: RnfABCDGE type electron transport complex subunit G [Bacteroidales bacterium]|nr:RnfABCDGE type electron transport complex subunit G [Bacteroidales bacterium]
MGKRESTFMSMVTTLSLVALVAASLLGGIYEVTKEPIRLAELKQKNDAIKAAVPEFDNAPSEEYVKIGMDGDSVVLYAVKKNGEQIATAVETFTNNGFSGRFDLMVGFDPEGKIINVAVINHSETPGLGDKMEQGKSDFHVQFQGKDPEDFKLMVKKDKGDVDAIAATTISSRAYCDAVQRAYDAFRAVKENSSNE